MLFWIPLRGCCGAQHCFVLSSVEQLFVDCLLCWDLLLARHHTTSGKPVLFNTARLGILGIRFGGRIWSAVCTALILWDNLCWNVVDLTQKTVDYLLHQNMQSCLVLSMLGTCTVKQPETVLWVAPLYQNTAGFLLFGLVWNLQSHLLSPPCTLGGTIVYRNLNYFLYCLGPEDLDFVSITHSISKGDSLTNLEWPILGLGICCFLLSFAWISRRSQLWCRHTKLLMVDLEPVHLLVVILCDIFKTKKEINRR